MGLPIVYFKGSQKSFLNYDVFLFLNVVLILSNSADPDEMQHNAAFHFGLHYLPKHPFRGFQYVQRVDYTTFTNFSMKYHLMCKVYTDVGGIK